MASNLVLKEGVKVTIRIMERSKSQLHQSRNVYGTHIRCQALGREQGRGQHGVYLGKVRGIVCVNPLPQLNPLKGR